MADDWIPVGPETFKRVAAMHGIPLREPGEIDLRERDMLTIADAARARQEHRASNLYGHEATIRIGEEQAKALYREQFNRDPDDKKNKVDVTRPGSTFMGNPLAVTPANPLPTQQSKIREGRSDG